MIVSDNPTKKALGTQKISIGGRRHTVGFWDSAQQRAVHFELVAPAKAVTASL